MSAAAVFLMVDGTGADQLTMDSRMVRHDPVVEAEITERSFAAMTREAAGAVPELHRRVIKARQTARSSSLDGLLGRIETVLKAG